MQLDKNLSKSINRTSGVSVAFFHSTPLRLGEDGNYYSVSLSASVWDKYLRHFDRVVASMPTAQGSVTGRQPVNAPAVEFMPLSPRGGLYRRLRGLLRRRRQVRDAVRTSEAVVARLPSWVGVAACREARRQKKPYAVEVVGCAWSAYWYHSLPGKVLAPANFLATRNAVRRATSALYVTDSYLQERYPTRAPWWSASNAEVSPPSDEQLRVRVAQLQGADRRRLRLATVGAVNVRYKGQETGIRALAELRSRGIDAEYHLVGGGSQQRLQAVAEKLDVAKFVVFHGVVSHERVLELLGQTDIYIHPSFTEGQPRAVVEAMSVATPVIGSTAGGTPENLPKEQTFSPGDVSALVGRVQMLLDGNLGTAAQWSAQRAQHFAPARLSRERDGYLSHLRKSVDTPPSAQKSSAE